jgi:hypothetical protein
MSISFDEKLLFTYFKKCLYQYLTMNMNFGLYFLRKFVKIFVKFKNKLFYENEEIFTLNIFEMSEEFKKK